MACDGNSCAINEIDAILERLMPPNAMLGNVDISLEGFEVDDVKQEQQKKDDGTKMFSFDEVTGDVDDFFIPNSCFNQIPTNTESNVFPHFQSQNNVTNEHNQENEANLELNMDDYFNAYCQEILRLFGDSIFRLTERLICLLQMAPAGYINFDQITEKLDTSQKRRIFDIVNVLEGLDLIQRLSKNILKWTGNMLLSSDDEKRFTRIKYQIEELEAKEKHIDEHMKWLKQSFVNVSECLENCKCAYMSHNDLRELFPELFSIAVQVPTAASIEANMMGETAESGKVSYQLVISSKSALPKVYILSEGSENITGSMG